MHDFVALDPSPSPWGSKTNRSGRIGNLSRLAKQPRSGLAFTGWRRPNASVVRVQEVFPAPLPRGERGCGQRPRCWQDPWGRAVGGKCAVGTHFKGFGFTGTEPALCSLAWLSGDRWAHVGSVAKAAPCALRPLSLDNLQVLVQSLPMAFG